MADIFISYSSRQRDFGRKLHSALTALQHPDGRPFDVWMDWEDIPVTSGWWAQIKQGIEEADNIVFLMSTEALGSPMCQLELEYARNLSKRIIVLDHIAPDWDTALGMARRRATTEAEIASILGERDILHIFDDNRNVVMHIQHIPFKADSDFDAVTETLHEAVLLDLDHARQHTDLLNAALKWDNRGREQSYLLTGEQITEAEIWLEQALVDKKRPEPDDLHITFIEESRRIENKQLADVAALEQRAETAQYEVNQADMARQRAQRIGLIVGVFSAIVIVVALFTVVSANQQAASVEATSVQQVANVNLQLTDAAQTILDAEATSEVLLQNARDEAEALYLAQLSSSEEGDVLATLLGIRALSTNYNENGVIYNALANAIDNLYVENVLEKHSDWVRGVEVLDDGRFLSFSQDSTLILWNSDGSLISRLDGHSASVSGVVVLDDGRFLSSNTDGTLTLWYDDPQSLIDYACTRVYRDFTPEERRDFDIDDEPTCPQFAEQD